MEEIITCAILAVISILFYLLSVLQFCGRGFLLNNAYLYASEKEKQTMNKNPYYRQSGVVFALLGTVFAINSADAILHSDWLIFCVIGIIVVTVIYAIASTVFIGNQKK